MYIICEADAIHLDAIMNIQELCYPPSMHESEHIFRRIVQDSQKCYVAKTEAHIVCGYLIAHNWNDYTSPPSLNSYELQNDANCIFIHDVAIHPEYRGCGIATMLVQRLMNDCEFDIYCLVAVNDSMHFWKRFQFDMLQSSDNDAINTYGTGAILMVRGKT